MDLETDDGGGDEASCRWPAYIVALVSCASLGAFLYWLCAYIAYCSFCEGKLVDQLCGQYQGQIE